MSDADPFRAFTADCLPVPRSATRPAREPPAPFPPSVLELARQELAWLERTLSIIRQADDVYQARLSLPTQWVDPRQLSLFAEVPAAEGGAS